MAKKPGNPDIQWVPPPDFGSPDNETLPPPPWQAGDPNSERPPVPDEPEPPLPLPDPVPPPTSEPPAPETAPLAAGGAGLDFVAEPPISPPKLQSIPLPSFLKPADALPVPEPETIHVGAPWPAPGNGRSEPLPAAPPSEVQTPAPVDQLTLVTRMVGVMEAMVARQQPPAPQPLQVMAPMTPEQGAHAFMTLLDERHARTLVQIAVASAQGSVAAVIAGILTQIADQDGLQNFAPNEDWLRKVHQPTPLSFAQGGGIPGVPPHQNLCEYCGHAFKPILSSNRQRFCCNACGNIAAGRTDEPLPHRLDCTTDPGAALAKAMRASRPTQDQVLQ